MSNPAKFDKNIDNYTLSELLLILDVETDVTPEIIDERTAEYIDRFEDENNTEMANFFRDMREKLDEYAEQLEGPDTAEYMPAEHQTKDWYDNQYISQDNDDQYDKITQRKDKVDIYDNNHLPMKREQLGVNNNYQVKVSQDSLNPNLKNITTRFVNLDSQFRQPTSNGESSATDYTLDLSEPMNNVLSMRLYSVQIPHAWYSVDVAHGTNCFWIVSGETTINISIESGNYTPQQLAIELNTNNSAFGSNIFTLIDDTRGPVTYNENNGKLTINISSSIITYTGQMDHANIIFFDPNGVLVCDSVCNPTRSLNQTLGWVMGYRFPAVKVDPLGNKASAMIDLYGPRYLILSIDDYNQNHINNGLITITETSKKLKMPNYYNPGLPTECNIGLPNDAIDNMDSSFKQVPTVIPTAPRVLTQAQIYSINQIKKNNENNTNYMIKAPTNSDTFAIIPIKHAGTTGSLFIDFGGSLQDNKRTYFGPVNIDRLRVKLQDDKGNVVNMNGADWSVTIICELLYQY
jgi:hypothetical protein